MAKYFVSVKAVGGDSATAAKRAVMRRSIKHTGKPRPTTDGQKKGRKPIVRQKNAAGWD